MSDICDKHKIEKHRPECSRCGGDGELEDDDDQFVLAEYRGVACWRCNGTGLAPWKTCELCEQEFQDEKMMEDE